MKPLLSALFLFANQAFAQSTSSLNLEAHEIGTTNARQSHWETDWGSYDRDYFRGKCVLITVRDMSRKVPRCELTAYFIAKPAGRPDAERFIYDSKTVPVDFRGRMEVIGPIYSRELKANIQNYALAGIRHASGADMEGWIIVGSLDNKTFQVRASSQALLEIAQENPRQTQSLQAMIAEYEKTKPKLRKSSVRPR